MGSCHRRIGICDFSHLNFLLILRSGSQNFGRKENVVHVMKMLFSTKNSFKGQLNTQQHILLIVKLKREVP